MIRESPRGSAALISMAALPPLWGARPRPAPPSPPSVPPHPTSLRASPSGTGRVPSPPCRIKSAPYRGQRERGGSQGPSSRDLVAGLWTRSAIQGPRPGSAASPQLGPDSRSPAMYTPPPPFAREAPSVCSHQELRLIHQRLVAWQRAPREGSPGPQKHLVQGVLSLMHICAACKCIKENQMSCYC